MLVVAGDVLRQEGGIGCATDGEDRRGPTSRGFAAMPAQRGKEKTNDVALVSVAAAFLAVSCLTERSLEVKPSTETKEKGDETEGGIEEEGGREVSSGEAERTRDKTREAKVEVGVEETGGEQKGDKDDENVVHAGEEETRVEKGAERLCCADATVSSIPFPSTKDTVVVDDVMTRLHDPAMKKLLEESDTLSLRVFDQKCLEVTSKKKKWRLRILTDSSACPRRCLGFIVYRIDMTLQALQVGKLAVLEECRGRGYGKKLVKGIIQLAKNNRGLTSINLSALTSAIGFYTVLGFKRHDDIPLPEGDGFSAPQVYMEMQLRRRACVVGQKKKK